MFLLAASHPLGKISEPLNQVLDSDRGLLLLERHLRFISRDLGRGSSFYPSPFASAGMGSSSCVRYGEDNQGPIILRLPCLE